MSNLVVVGASMVLQAHHWFQVQSYRLTMGCGCLHLLKPFMIFQVELFHHFIFLNHNIISTMAKYQRERQLFFSNTRQTQIIQYLELTDSLNFMELRDDKGNTALHHSAFMNNSNVLKASIEKAQQIIRGRQVEEESFNKKIISWINTKNIDGFTAINYASFKGNIQILAFLQNKGANIHLKTKNGQNSLHLAAQANKVQTFLYFKDKISFNSRDNKLSTPLHWAAFNGSELVAEYLLAQPNVQKNVRDSNGQTPLHIATSEGRTKVVKKLLLSGCQKNVRNKNHQTPMMIAEDNDFEMIQRMLKDKFTCNERCKIFWGCMNVYAKNESSFLLPILFILALLLFSGALYYERGSSSLDYDAYVGIGLNGITFLFHLNLTFSRKKSRKLKQEEILQLAADPEEICFTCMSRKPENAFHCQICQICNEKYDHHCFWINRCVAKGNIHRFHFYVLFIILSFMWLLMMGIFFQINFDNNLENIVLDHEAIARTIGGIQILAAVILLPPIIYLYFVQLKNIYLGKTTHERFARGGTEVDFRSFETQRFKQRKKRYQGNCRNFYLFLCCCCSEQKIKKTSESTMKTEQQQQLM